MSEYRWHAALKRLKEEKKIRVAEVGVWRGVMSEKLLEGNKYIRLIQIDRWKQYNYRETFRENYTRFSLKKQQSFEIAKEENLKRTKKYKKRIRLIEKSSVEAAHLIKDRSLEMVFIDALHSYAGCRIDILLYKNKVKLGGWIGGHDIHRLGVARAVKEIFGDDVEYDVDNTWWVKI